MAKKKQIPEPEPETVYWIDPKTVQRVIHPLPASPASKEEENDHA